MPPFHPVNGGGIIAEITVLFKVVKVCLYIVHFLLKVNYVNHIFHHGNFGAIHFQQVVFSQTFIKWYHWTDGSKSYKIGPDIICMSRPQIYLFEKLQNSQSAPDTCEHSWRSSLWTSSLPKCLAAWPRAWPSEFHHKLANLALAPESEKTQGQVSRSADEQSAQLEICLNWGRELPS